MKERLIKSKERVKKFAEVFTPTWLADDMIELVGDEVSKIKTRVLEPAVGEGVFLIQILKRKVANAKTIDDMFILLGSLYGVDIQLDNVQITREKIFELWKGFFIQVTEENPNADEIRAAKTIIEKNIIQGDMLSGLDANQKQLHFSFWEQYELGIISEVIFPLDGIVNNRSFPSWIHMFERWEDIQ